MKMGVIPVRPWDEDGQTAGKDAVGLERALAGFPRNDEGKIIVDLETPLETLVKLTAAGGFFLFFFGLLERMRRTSESPAMMMIGAIVFAVGLLLWYGISVYLLIDPQSGDMENVTEIFNIGLTMEVASRSEICGFGVTEVHRSGGGNSPSYHQYWGLMLLQRGDLVRVTDKTRDNCSPPEETCRDLAKAYGVPFLEAKSGCRVVAGRDPGSTRPCLVYRQRSWLGDFFS